MVQRLFKYGLKWFKKLQTINRIFERHLYKYRRNYGLESERMRELTQIGQFIGLLKRYFKILSMALFYIFKFFPIGDSSARMRNTDRTAYQIGNGKYFKNFCLSYTQFKASP